MGDRASAAGAEARAVATVCGGLAHPMRVRIVNELAQGRQSARSIRGIFGESVSLGKISYHLHTLRRVGLIGSAGTARSRGTIEHFYELSELGRSVLHIIDQLARASKPARRRRPP